MRFVTEAIAPAMEAMDFKINTKFAQNFTALMQKMIDYRNNLPPDAFAKRRETAFNYFASDIMDPMCKMIEDFCGYDLEEFATDTNGQYSFATAHIIGDEKAASPGQFIDAGTSYFPSKKVTKADTLISIANSFNRAEGNLFPEAREQVKKYIRVALYFDFNMAFFAHELTGVMEFELTAREITAIILHEIGHIMRLVEHAADGYARLNAMKMACASFEQSAPVAEKIILLEQITDKVKKGEMTVDKEVMDAIQTVTQDATDIALSDMNALTKILGPVLRAVFAPLNMFSVLPMVIAGTNIPKSRGKGSAQMFKYGDLPTSLRDVNRSEVQADQYANRHGYGADIVSALDKMDRIDLLFGYGEAAIVASKHASSIDKVAQMLAAFSEFMAAPIMAQYDNNVYPIGWLRFQKIQQDCIAAMKSGAANPQTVAYYVREYEKIQKIIVKRSLVNKWGEYGRKLYTTISYYVSLPGIASMIIDGRVTKELQTLLTQLDALNSNPLYYYGIKLKQLASK